MWFFLSTCKILKFYIKSNLINEVSIKNIFKQVQVRIGRNVNIKNVLIIFGDMHGKIAYLIFIFNSSYTSSPWRLTFISPVISNSYYLWSEMIFGGLQG